MQFKKVGPELPGASRSSAELEAEVAEIVAEVQKAPGEWFEVASFNNDPAKSHRRRESILKRAPKGLEVQVRTPNVYARWVGEDIS